MSPYSLELSGTDFKPLYSVLKLFYKKKFHVWLLATEKLRMTK